MKCKAICSAAACKVEETMVIGGEGASLLPGIGVYRSFLSLHFTLVYTYTFLLACCISTQSLIRTATQNLRNSREDALEVALL